MPTVIQPCTCVSKFQDSKYGKGQRVHNTSMKEKGKASCTVCGVKK